MKRDRFDSEMISYSSGKRICCIRCIARIIIDKEVTMRRIEENRSAWEHARANHTTSRQRKTAAYAAKNVAARYTKASGKNSSSSQNTSDRSRINPRSYASPEYQNDISARSYEVASWLQEMGETGAAGMQGSSDATSNPEQSTPGAGWNWRPVGNGMDFEQSATGEMDLEELEEEQEKASQLIDPDEEQKKAETELERLKKMLETMKQKKEDAKKSKKKLPYRYQQVSTAIRGAKNIMQASNALTKATSSLTQVRRQASSGKYSEKEISIASTHARKMVRTARKKLRNLKAEFLQKNDGVRCKNDTSQKMGIVVKRSEERKKLETMQEKDRELMKLTREIQAAEVKYKNRHRRKENWELMEADMEYLRRRIAYLKNQENERETQDRIEASTEAVQTGEITADGTNMFTSAEQSVILEQEAVVDATVKEANS